VALHVKIPHQSYGNGYQGDVEHDVDDRESI
jgi:hypothetical protein